jgi:UDP-GlcNAc:undecaprenyl-phosphate GlcNAc-1-phosphate transferase
MVDVVGAAASAFLLTVVLTPVTRTAARRARIVAIPRDDRWHRRPTALLGGLAICFAFLAGLAMFGPDLTAAGPVVAAAVLLCGIGLVDDLFDIRPVTKLVGQIVAALIVVGCGIHLPWTASAPLNASLTVLWLVGITNATNLLDNMDGLAAGISAIAAVFLTVTFLVNGQTQLAVLPALLCGAALGFLVFNFKPASIFMGDSGSMFLGFALGGIGLLSQYGRSRNVGAVLLTPVLILTIPILDTCLVTVTRKLAGRAVSQGGRDHTSHRLVALGGSEVRAVLTLYVLAALCGLFAVGVRWLRSDTLLVVLPGFALVVVVFALYLGAVRVGPPRTALRTPVPPLQRAGEVLLDVLLIFLAYYAAFLIRFDWELPPDQRAIVVQTVPIVLAVELAALYLGGVYTELWRHARVEDLLVIVRSVIGGAVGSLALVLLLHGGTGPSRGALVLNGLLLLLFVGASRLAFRLLDAVLRAPAAAPDARPVLIYGAGAGALLLREMLEGPESTYRPVGFIDDDQGKRGRRVRGVRVFGSEELPAVIHRHGINEILLPNPGVDADRVARLQGLGLFVRRMSLRFE